MIDRALSTISLSLVLAGAAGFAGLTATAARAQEATLRVRLPEQLREDPDRERGWPVKVLREAGLEVACETSNREPIQLVLFSGLVRDRELVWQNRTRPFACATGDHVPGDQFVPGDQVVPGDQLVPGDQFVPGDPLIIDGIVIEEHMLREAERSRERLGLERAETLFVVALPARPEEWGRARTTPLMGNYLGPGYE